MLLWGACGAGSVLTLLVLVWAFVSPLALAPAGAPPATPAVATRSAAGSGLPPLASFAPLLKLDLRQPLEGNAPAAMPTLTVKLAGMILEPGRNMAMFQDKDGAVQLKAVGETIAGAEVRQISDTGVVLFYAGQEMILTMEPRP